MWSPAVFQRLPGRWQEAAFLGCAAIGALWVAAHATALARFAWRRILRPTPDLFTLYGSRDASPWAVVTGGSDGIGKAIAMELAHRGFSVVIIARTVTKLEETRQEIIALYGENGSDCQRQRGVKVVALPFDFALVAGPDADTAYSSLSSKIESATGGFVRVGVLVNNVGMNYSEPDYVEAIPLRRHLDVTWLNIGSQLRMSKLFLSARRAAMVAEGTVSRPQGKAAIVNISSASAMQAVPRLTTYAASKAFNKTLSECLRIEVSNGRCGDVDVLTCTPAYVVSNMNPLTKPTITVPAAAAFARQALNELPDGGTVYGHVNHEVLLSLFGMLPLALQRLLMHRSMDAKVVRMKAGFEGNRTAGR